MRPARYQILVDKSVNACIAALEIYNKPDFRYREEAFSILMLNAWELVLKARVLKESGGKMRSIEVWEPRRKKDGSKSKRQQIKLNRSGNPLTIGINRAIELVRHYSTDKIDARCIENLHLLVEIRDSAIHFHNISAGLGKRIQEVGSASIRNYVRAIEDWFKVDLDKFNFYIMPLTFHSPSDVVESLRSENHPQAVKNLLERIAEAERDNPSDEEAAYNVTMRVQLKFVRTSGEDAIRVRIARGDPKAIAVILSEADIRKTFPWTYAELASRLNARYSDFLQNNHYHEIRKPLEEDERLCRVRFLDPSKPGKSSKMRFYSPNIIAEFDKHYTRNQ